MIEESEVHHAPGIPCGLARRCPAIPIWYTSEPGEVTCRHRACRKWARTALAAAAVLAGSLVGGCAAVPISILAGSTMAPAAQVTTPTGQPGSWYYRPSEASAGRMSLSVASEINVHWSASPAGIALEARVECHPGEVQFRLIAEEPPAQDIILNIVVWRETPGAPAGIAMILKPADGSALNPGARLDVMAKASAGAPCRGRS